MCYHFIILGGGLFWLHWYIQFNRYVYVSAYTNGLQNIIYKKEIHSLPRYRGFFSHLKVTAFFNSVELFTLKWQQIEIKLFLILITCTLCLVSDKSLSDSFSWCYSASKYRECYNFGLTYKSLGMHFQFLPRGHCYPLATLLSGVAERSLPLWCGFLLKQHRVLN